LASPRCFCDEIVGRGLGHCWIIGYRSSDGLPKVTGRKANGLPNRLNTPSTRGLSPRPDQPNSRCAASSPLASDAFWQTVGRLGLLSGWLWILRFSPWPPRIPSRVGDRCQWLVRIMDFI
jgi:hypothetical protein